jgi:hypothetical protein
MGKVYAGVTGSVRCEVRGVRLENGSDRVELESRF